MGQFGNTLCWFIGTIMLVGTIVLVVLIVTSKHHHDCTPSKKMPVYDNKTVPKNLFSEKDKLVANIIGHVEFRWDSGDENGNKTKGKGDLLYMPLVMTNVSLSNPVDANSTKITFDGPCLSFDIQYVVNEASGNLSRSYGFTHFTMNVKNITEPGQPKRPANCVNLPIQKMGANLRFSCKEEMKLRCTSEEKQKILILKLKSLEFELEGDPDRVKKGEFSREVWEESCDDVTVDEDIEDASDGLDPFDGLDGGDANDVDGVID